MLSGRVSVRKDVVLRQLQALLEPFGLTRFYTAHWGGLHLVTATRRPRPGQTDRAANRVEASHPMDEHAALDL